MLLFCSSLQLVACLLLSTSTITSSQLDGPSLNNMESWIPLASQTEGANNVDGPHPLKLQFIESNQESTLIFVGIVDYRDARCSMTMDYLFSRAKYPERIRIGIVQQRHTEEDHFHCLRDFCNAQTNPKYCQQVRFVEFTHQLARGPAYARYLQQSLIRNEDFCLQIDSHVEVIQDWDIKLVHQWMLTENEYAILSTYPVDISAKDNSRFIHSTNVPHLCQATFDSREFVVNLPPSEARHLTRPLLSSLYHDGFSFSKCHADRKVPNDPDYQMIHDSYEFAKYARLWTHGYDVYSPSEVIVFHDYLHRMPLLKATIPATAKDLAMQWSHPKGDPDLPRFLYDRAVEKIQTVLGHHTPVPEAQLEKLTFYGLGNKRSLTQFLEFTGMDIVNKRVISDRCIDLTWVPYTNLALNLENDIDAEVDFNDIWGFAPEMISAAGANIPVIKSRSLSFQSLDGYTTVPKSKDTKVEEVVEEVIIPKSDVISNHNQHERRSKSEVENGKEVKKTGTLWFIFSFLDNLIDSTISSVDQQYGAGHGLKVVRVMLMVLPLVAGIVLCAVYALMPSGQRKTNFFSVTDYKRV